MAMGFAINPQTNEFELMSDQCQGSPWFKAFAWQNFNATFNNGSNWVESDIKLNLIEGVDRRAVFEPTKALREISFHAPILSLGWQTGDPSISSPNQGSNANGNKGNGRYGMHPLDWHPLGKLLTNPDCRSIGQHHPQCGANGD